MSELEKYPLGYEEKVTEVPDDASFFAERVRYVPMCEALQEGEECPNRATIEWFRREDGDYLYTLRCDEHPVADSVFYEMRDL